MLNADPDIEVVGIARNGKQAVELAKTLKPDVITLDIEMPEMDGLTALRHIMRTAPTQVLMLSSLTTEGSAASLQALKLGAADVLAKDSSQGSMSINSLQHKLIRIVKALAQSNPHRLPRDEAASAAGQTTHTTELPHFRPTQFDLVCIGSSTGGPPVLETILGTLPATFQPPIVVAQHMPEIFTRSMAERLGKLCALNVIHVEERETLKPGHIYLARGGKHIHVQKTSPRHAPQSPNPLTASHTPAPTHACRLADSIDRPDALKNACGLAPSPLNASHSPIPLTAPHPSSSPARLEVFISDEPTDALYRPSADALFASAAHATAARTLAIVLTGIGADGTRGAKQIHAAGGVILAQNQATSVVYGMPKSVTEAGLTTANLSPDQIAQALTALARANAA